VLRQSLRVLFPSWSSFVEEVLPTMINETMDHQYVLPNLASTTIIFASFDLWMFRGGVDIFSMVINFMNDI
jgi:hypothetical protein